MIIRPTTEKHGSFDVFLIGATADNLVRHYFEPTSKEYIECPMGNADIAAFCNLSYTNKDGKVYYTQKGSTEVIDVTKDAIVTKHSCEMGAKKEKVKTFIAITSHATMKKNREKGEWFPDFKFDIAADQFVFSAIKALK